MKINKINKKSINRKLEKINFLRRTTKNSFDKIKVENFEYTNLCSNDYLGLSKNKELISKSALWLENYGTSLSSSRMISGNLANIELIEDSISKYTKNEKTLIMGSGFLLNSTLIPSISGNNLGSRNDVTIFSDKLNHYSINFGCMMSKQKILRYRHLDLNHLEFLLKKNKGNSQKMIISETLFSMDGDILNINDIRYLAEKYNCILYLDEAHSMGIFGDYGFGLASKGKKIENEVVVGTFGKAFGSYGSFVSTTKKNIEIVTNLCGALIYSTSLPPAVLGAISAAVEIIPKLSKDRNMLLKNSKDLIKRLNKMNINTLNSSSHIIPMVFENIQTCEKIAKFLKDNKFFVKTIKPPTVPEGMERIRLSLTSTMNKIILDDFLKVISRFKANEI